MASPSPSPSPLKRPSKPSTKPSKKPKTLTLTDLKSLSHDLLSSRSHLNNLPVLLSFLSSAAEPHLAAESLITVHSFFLPLLPQIPSAAAAAKKPPPSDDVADADLVFRNWLKERFDEFIDRVLDIAVSEESDEAIRDVALETLMDFVKLGKGGKFQTVIYHRFLNKLVQAESDVDPLLELLATKYFKYLDCRYFTYTSMDKILKNFGSAKDSEKVAQDDGKDSSEKRMEHSIHIAYSILSLFPPLEPDNEQSFEMWSELGILSKDGEKNVSPVSKSETMTSNKTTKGLQTNQIMRRIKSKFTRAWISFLKLPLPLDVYKEVLVSLHQNVIPYMANPSILCDFLTKSYDIGGVISVMALSGLFILMTKHGLEYPKFYEKLYALLTPAVFMAKHRAVFFQLLDSCLKSSYLPAYLAAAFAKKLSRLALSVPPAGELIIIAVIHNLLRRHPSINFLVHQEADQNGEEAKESANTVTVSQSLSGDQFDMEESDPVKSKAMRSSLWEIETLRHHYSPAVSRFVASLEKDLTVRSKTSEIAVKDFSSGSYATVFGDEMRRRIKEVPLAFYRTTPCSLFSEYDFPGWSFGEKQTGTEVLKDEANGVIT